MTPSFRLRLDIEDAPSEADVEVLPNRLEAFNENRWPGHQQWRPLAVFARDRGRIVAGLGGETYSGWLFIRCGSGWAGRRAGIVEADSVPVSGRKLGCSILRATQ